MKALTPETPEAEAPGQAARATLILIALAVAIFFCFLPALTARFLPDDRAAITANPSIQDLSNLRAILTTEGASDMVRSRPVVNLTLALTYAAGESAPWIYRWTNLLIHIVCAWVLFGLLRTTLRQPVISRACRDHADLLAGAAAAIWALHPINVMPVVSVVQRAESLMALCYLGAVWAAAGSAIASSRAARLGLAALAVIVLIIGSGAKEVIVTAPLVIIGWEAAFRYGDVVEAWRRRWRFYLVLPVAWIPLLISVLGPWGRAATVSIGEGNGSWSYLLAQGQAVLTYVKLLIVPYPLIADYGPTPDYPLALGLALGAVVLTLAIGAVWLFLRRPAVGLAPLAFFVILAPTSTVVPLFTTIAEVRVYLPSAALIALAVVGVRLGADWLLTPRGAAKGVGPGDPKPSTRGLNATLALTMVAAMALGLGVVMRTALFRDEGRLWSDVVAKRPDNYRGHANLGTHYYLQGDFDRAIASYTEAIRRFERDPKLHYGRSLARNAAGDHLGAVRDATRALHLNRNMVSGYLQRGVAFRAMGEHRSAIADFGRALDLQPGHARALMLRGQSYEEIGLHRAALVDYTALLRANPGHAEAFFRRAGVLTELGSHEAALRDYSRSLQLAARSPQALTNRGTLLTRMNDFPGALADFDAAIDMDPDFTQAYTGKVYALLRLDRRAEAQRFAREALDRGVKLPEAVRLELGL